MRAKERVDLKDIVNRLRVKADELDDLADEILAVTLKKTTQRSPEWHGATNKMTVTGTVAATLTL